MVLTDTEQKIGVDEQVNSEDLLKGLRLPIIRRYPKYLRLLWNLALNGREVISSDRIATELNLDSITVRKDLAFTGVIGKPRIGYPIPQLIKGIEKIIKSSEQTNIILVGVGNLGTALLGYPGFERHGYSILAAFDADPVKIGTMVHDKPVLAIDQLEGFKDLCEHDIGALCVPENVAQEVADQLIKIGLKAIWNFTNVELKVPSDVCVLSEDLAASLVVLSVNLKRSTMRSERKEK